jgi:hypothetical protein
MNKANSVLTVAKFRRRRKMHGKIKTTGRTFLLVLIFNFLFNNYAFCQQLAVKRQTDGTIKIHSTQSQTKVRIARMVYCRTIDELIKEEKDSLNRLISENRYDEIKDSIEIIEGLRQLKLEKCK